MNLYDVSIRHFIKKNILKPMLVLLTITLCGSVGYHLIEGWSFFDGFYMTVITLATVGYNETHPLSAGGRLFTVALIISSIGFVGYIISAFTSFIIEGEFNKLMKGRRMDKSISKLNNHIILCGSGPTGQSIADEFIKTKTPFILIERDPEVIKQNYNMDQLHYIEGDATQDETLLLAGIKRAKGLISALGEDKDNVFVVLTARAQNPSLRIVSRVIDENNVPKLKKAGADEVVSPNAIGGLRIASVMLRPKVVSFLDAMLRVPDQTIRIEDFTITEDSPLCNQTLGEINIGKKFGLLVVAIDSSDKGYLFNPGAKTLLSAKDTLIVMGTLTQLERLKQFAKS